MHHHSFIIGCVCFMFLLHHVPYDRQALTRSFFQCLPSCVQGEEDLPTSSSGTFSPTTSGSRPVSPPPSYATSQAAVQALYQEIPPFGASHYSEADFFSETVLQPPAFTTMQQPSRIASAPTIYEECNPTPHTALHQLSTSSKHKDQGQDRVAPGRWSPRPASPTLPALLFPPSKKYRQGLSGSNDQGSCREGGLTRPSAQPYRPPALREREGSQPVPVQPNVRDPSSTSSASLSTLRATSLQPLWPAPSKCGFHRNPRGSQNPELPLGRGSSPSSHQPALQLTSPSEAPSQQG